MQRIVRHGNVAVLGHDEINAHEARVGCCGFKAEERLRKYLLLGETAQDLAKVANLDAASWRGVSLSTVFAQPSQSFCLVDLGPCGRDFVAQTMRQ